MDTFEDVLDHELGRMREVMIDRQRKYGPTNIEAGGVHGLIVRMRDKLARIEEDHKTCPFLGKCIERELSDEAHDDAWLDLANYSGPIALALMGGLWGKPLAGDFPGVDKVPPVDGSGNVAWQVPEQCGMFMHVVGCQCHKR